MTVKNCISSVLRLQICINCGPVVKDILACRAGVFLASERSDFLREMFGRHLGFFRQRKVGERNKFLPWGGW